MTSHQRVAEAFLGATKLAAITPPKRGITPAYDKNIMAVPLMWGGNGPLRPENVVGSLSPLFEKAIHGVAFVLDTNEVLKNIPNLGREIARRVADTWSENAAMTSEYHEDAKPGSGGWDAITRANNQARALDNLRVTLTPVTSPRTGVPGLRLTFSPTYEEISRLGA